MSYKFPEYGLLWYGYGFSADYDPYYEGADYNDGAGDVYSFGNGFSYSLCNGFGWYPTTTIIVEPHGV